MNYAELSGGVSAWGLGGMGATRRGGFGSGGALGGVSASTPPAPPANEDYLTGEIATVYLTGADGAFLLGAA